MQETLNKIKEFESVLKKCLLDTYGQFLPEDKIALLNITNYTSEELINGRNEEQIRGDLARMMLDDLIDVRCFKEIQINDELTLPLPYANYLEVQLIEYYAKKISEKYNFKIDEIEDFSLEEIKQLNDKLNGTLEKYAFNDDALELLKIADIKELTQQYDKDSIEEYFERVNIIADTNKDKNEENKMMMENSQREGSIQIVWLHEKKYIKYIDRDGIVHLTQVIDNGQTEDFYKQKLASLKPDEKLDPESFYNELKKYAEEMALRKTSEVKKEYLNNEQVNMYQFVNSNPKIKEIAKKDNVTHNNEMNVHVIQETKDIVVTKDESASVSAQIIKDGNAKMSDSIDQKTDDISSELISKEKYEELLQRFERGEQLSMEELESLRRATIEYSKNQESYAVLKPGNKKIYE